MKKSEIIHILKEPIAEVMERCGKDAIPPIFASRTMAYCLWLYDKKKVSDTDIRDLNNPFGDIDPSTGNKINFNSITEAVLNFHTNKGVSEEFDKVYDSISKANNLYRFDKEYLDKISGPVIDLDEDQCRPNIDVYTVKDENNNEILRTSDLDEAKAEKKKQRGRTITDSRNRVIDHVVKPYKSNDMISLQLKPGAKVECKGLNLYYKVSDKKPGRSISGTFYLFDGKETNGRYSICSKPEFASSNKNTIIGYINSKDIKK